MENNKSLMDMEFEEMRQQMAELKQQLDQRIQVDEERLKKDIIENKERISSFGTWMLVAGVLAAIFVPALFYYMYHFSILCCVVTSVLVLCDSGFDFYNAHRIKNNDLSSKNFTEALRTLVSMKKSNRNAFAIGVAVVIPMLVWWGVEIYGSPFFRELHPDTEEFARWIVIVFGLIGGCVGLVVTTSLYRKQTRNINALIKMIEDNKE
ncbi:MAG: hypothetical protein Q4B68_09805 [Bacteroidales bacterium]|nr:hypothetical protein [Bacteroidales bacterium]